MKIDFVLLWVDGSDINWLNEKKLYDKSIVDAGSSASRFRDWNNLQYWFRGVEQCAPWVNRIYFITWGHTPSWLNLDCPKLKIVRHSDYIPAEYLPTYNSNAIELNLHRIPSLSEHFVLFNDDTFILRPVGKEMFFVDGKPCDRFVMNAILPHYNMPIIGHTSVNNVAIINKYFKKREVTKRLYSKIYNAIYGSGMVRNCLLSSWGEFTGFYNFHLPLPHLKSTFETLWEKEYDQLHQTSLNKFRQYNDLNHWVMRYWNLCEGNFVPNRTEPGKMFTVGSDNEKIIKYIRGQKGPMVCVNDSISDFDFEKAAAEINGALESLFPDKSRFEI